MVESADTRDLKSLGSNTVPVQVRLTSTKLSLDALCVRTLFVFVREFTVLIAGFFLIYPNRVCIYSVSELSLYFAGKTLAFLLFAAIESAQGIYQTHCVMVFEI